MSLNFNNTLFIPGNISQRSQDDLYLRGPVLLAKTQVNPLTTKLASEFIGKTWRLATTGKDNLVQGARFENALWRMWRQEMLGLKKTSTSGIDRDQLERTSIALFIPVVVSHETCHARDQLLLVSSVGDDMPDQTRHAQSQSKQPTMTMSCDLDESISSLSTRPCLKKRSTSERSDSPLSFRTTMSRSPDEYPKRHVMFNSCVVQGMIVNLPVTEGSTDNDYDSLEVHSESLQDPTGYLTVEDCDTGSESETHSISRCRTLIQDDFLVIQALPPIELFPPPEMEERDVNIVFVPPLGMEDLEEGSLFRLEKPPSSLKKTASSRDLARHKQDLEHENSLCEVKQAISSGLIGHWDDDGNDGEEGELVMRKRRRHTKAFVTTMEDSLLHGGDENDPEEEGNWAVISTLHRPSDEGGESQGYSLEDSIAQANNDANITFEDSAAVDLEDVTDDIVGNEFKVKLEMEKAINISKTVHTESPKQKQPGTTQNGGVDRVYDHNKEEQTKTLTVGFYDGAVKAGYQAVTAMRRFIFYPGM